MEPPKSGSNSTQSYFDFDTLIGKFRFGVENMRMFFQKNLNQHSSPDTKKRYLDGIVEDQLFIGEVSLSEGITHYSPYTVATNIVCTIAANPIKGGSAFMRMIADGSHTPVFTAFKKSAGSQDWDTTLNAIHVVGFGYDGVDAWYSIDKEA